MWFGPQGTLSHDWFFVRITQGGLGWREDPTMYGRSIQRSGAASSPFSPRKTREYLLRSVAFFSCVLSLDLLQLQNFVHAAWIEMVPLREIFVMCLLWILLPQLFWEDICWQMLAQWVRGLSSYFLCQMTTDVHRWSARCFFFVCGYVQVSSSQGHR